MDQVPRPVAVLAVDGRLAESLADMATQVGLDPETSETGLAAFAQVGRTNPPVVVLELAIAGTIGTRLVSALIAVSPNTTCFVLVESQSMLGVAIEAGASQAFLIDDLRGLKRAMGEVVQRPAPAV